ncbi:hypothetical protein CXG81DRAFT_25569 [Caulochytrium protostelioides]|uniref:Uncharacterized protein n=1 Tax=Caulochytrium protostelioides TaxID=1555241 RepID=A0A4V1IUU0_9FUNG|nr:hypothetical protein CXG81DRAFT_25569 [Caulochytrium protostelioides]|eukprot:RKP01729.1 hypothetical protein CXG81DRAFT_25569 [Caulochytrium protostelioides]
MRATAARRWASTQQQVADATGTHMQISVRQWIGQFLPNVRFTSQTTLGEIWENGVVKYKYRMAYSIIAWAGLLHYAFWSPYKTKEQLAEERAAIEAREALSA